MSTIYFQPKGINPRFCEVGMISETDKDYIWYLNEILISLTANVRVLGEEADKQA